MTLDGVLARLGSVKRRGNAAVARCPAHDDHRPSLSIKATPDGKILLKCFAGCRTDDVVLALGLSMRDLFARVSRP